MVKRLDYGKLIGNWILIAGLLLSCLCAFHDMQTAEGVGLYFSLKMGMEQRIWLDVAVDVLGMAALAVLVYLPCRCFGHGTSGAYLRLLIGYLAVVPQLSLAKVIHLFGAEEPLFLGGMSLREVVLSGIANVIPFLQIWVPLFVLLYGIASVREGFSLNRVHKGLLTFMVIVLLWMLVCPSMENLLLYVSGYLGLLVAFDCWESLFQKLPEIKKWYLLLFGLLLLKGIYRIIVLMSQF